MRYLKILSVIIFLIACNDDNRVNYSDITQTDADGNIISEDKTDWRVDDVWNENVYNIFYDSSNFSTIEYNYHPHNFFSLKSANGVIPSDTNALRVDPLYPNPFADKGIVNFYLRDTGSFKALVVDNDLNIIKSYFIESHKGNININTDGIENIETNKIYRFYYMSIIGNEEFYGHGDFYKK